MATAIKVKDLSKTYTEGLIFRKNHRALQNVELQVERGEVFGLLGPNGAGKTTLIKILLGILHPTQGVATLLDLPAGSKAARRKIGYLPENLIFPRHHTGRSALYFYGRLSELSDAQIAKKEKEIFELVDLTGREHEPVRRYSKGMRQRLGLAQALLHDPELLIMDEPTDGLDPMGRSQIRDLLMRLKGAGKTVFLNSHILQEVELICDRVAIMALGELKAMGHIDELVRSSPLSVQPVVRLELHLPPGLTLAQATAGFATKTVRPVSCANPLVGTTPLVASDMGALEIATLDQYSDFRIELELEDQASVDRLIDQLRSLNVSVTRMERLRPSLEQVFMNFVSNVPPHLPKL